MKGYVNVPRTDLLAAIIGFELRYDAAKELRDKGIRLFYEKHFTNSGRFNRWWNRKKSMTEFARSRMCAFDRWSDVLHEVLTREETDEVDWWCWTHKSEINPLRELYKASSPHDSILIDESMATVINKYKEHLEDE